MWHSSLRCGVHVDDDGHIVRRLALQRHHLNACAAVMLLLLLLLLRQSIFFSDARQRHVRPIHTVNIRRALKPRG